MCVGVDESVHFLFYFKVRFQLQVPIYDKYIPFLKFLFYGNFEDVSIFTFFVREQVTSLAERTIRSKVQLEYYLLLSDL